MINALLSDGAFMEVSPSPYFLHNIYWSSFSTKREIVCRELHWNPNLWEAKQIEKTHAKEKKNNYMHKTIFTWFGNLPTSTELQGFYYYQGKYNSAQEHSQETQFPITPWLSHMAALTRLLGIIPIAHSLHYISNLIYIYIYMSKSAVTRNCYSS